MLHHSVQGARRRWHVLAKIEACRASNSPTNFKSKVQTEVASLFAPEVLDQGFSDLGLVKRVTEQRLDLVTLVKNTTLAIVPACNEAGWGHIVIADDDWDEPVALAHSMQTNGRLFDKETPDQHAEDDSCLHDELDDADNVELQETDPEFKQSGWNHQSRNHQLKKHLQAVQEQVPSRKSRHFVFIERSALAFLQTARAVIWSHQLRGIGGASVCPQHVCSGRWLLGCYVFRVMRLRETRNETTFSLPHFGVRLIEVDLVALWRQKAEDGTYG
eukprot:5387682-Amphidinium_carterae.1